MSRGFPQNHPDFARRRVLCGLAAAPAFALMPNESSALPATCTDDPWSNNARLSINTGAPPAVGAPSACLNPGAGRHSVAYRGAGGSLHWISVDARGSAHWTDLSEALRRRGITVAAEGNPFLYTDGRTNSELLFFRDSDSNIRSIYYAGQVGIDNLTGVAGAPSALGDPVGFYRPGADDHHVVYQGADRHLHLLHCVGEQPIAYGGNLTNQDYLPSQRAAGPSAPSAFFNGRANFVIYRADDGHIMSLSWSEGPSNLDNLTGYTQAPRARGAPAAYYTAHNDCIQVAYVGTDGHIYEIYGVGDAPAAAWRVTATPPLNFAPWSQPTIAAYYSAARNRKHIVYAVSGRLYDLSWTPGVNDLFLKDLTSDNGAQTAQERAAGLETVSTGASTQRIVYRASDNHIYEVRIEESNRPRQQQPQQQRRRQETPVRR